MIEDIILWQKVDVLFYFNETVMLQFDAEFRRFSINRADVKTYEDFRTFIETLHRLSEVPFLISYSDPKDGDLLPINNDDNLARALTVKPLLRIILQRKGKFWDYFVNIDNEFILVNEVLYF